MARKTTDEFLRERVSWAEQIAQKDKTFKDYAGAEFQTALKMAKIDTMLKIFPKEHVLSVMLRFQRAYLIQRKKAEFVSFRAGEISLLGFLRGSKPFDINAKLNKVKL